MTRRIRLVLASVCLATSFSTAFAQEGVAPPKLVQPPPAVKGDLPAPTDPADVRAPSKPIFTPPVITPPVTPPIVSAPDKPVVTPPSTPPNVPAPDKPNVPPASGCVRMAAAVQSTLQRYVGRFIARLAYHMQKRVLGVKLDVLVTPPKVTFAANATGNGIRVSVQVAPGELAAGIDAGFFGQHQGRVTFPQSAQHFDVTVPCPAQCSPIVAAMAQRVVGALNDRVIARLPTTLSLGQLHLFVKWPRLAVTKLAAGGFIVNLSRWGALGAAWGERTRLSFQERLLFAARDFVVPCPTAPNPPTPPNPPAPPKPVVDPVLTCNQQIPHKIHFVTDRAEINPGYKDNAARLGELQAALATIPAQCALTIVGHTDCQGTLAHNTALSQHRAMSARAWSLPRTPAHVQHRGIGVAWRAFTKPFCRVYRPNPRIPMDQQCTSAPRHPRTTNQADACMVANRRVEFVLTPVR